MLFMLFINFPLEESRNRCLFYSILFRLFRYSRNRSLCAPDLLQFLNLSKDTSRSEIQIFQYMGIYLFSDFSIIFQIETASLFSHICLPFFGQKIVSPFLPYHKRFQWQYLVMSSENHVPPLGKLLSQFVFHEAILKTGTRSARQNLFANCNVYLHGFSELATREKLGHF